MKELRKFVRQTISEYITPNDLKSVENYADDLFSDVGVDVEFTRHFLDRANDLRNKVDITPGELKDLYKKTYDRYADAITKLPSGTERVITDPETNINVPFVLNWDGKSPDMNLINKTVMRKKDFKSYTPKLHLEDIEENIDVPINVGDEVLGGKFKNKKIIVKDIDKNEKGDITINDKPLLKVRIKKEIEEGSVKTSDKIDIYRDNNYVVVRPLTEQASCKYGAYTKWCISAPSSGAWESNPDAVIIMIIQRNYTSDQEKEKTIQNFLDYHELYENGEVTPEIQKKWDDYMDENNYDYHDFEDLSKIALVFGGHNVEIWDSNNIPLNDNYQYGWQTLPISDNVKDAIENYIASTK